MLTLIKNYFAQKKAKKTQMAEHDKMKKYYERLQTGAIVLQYIHNDMEQQKKKMSRHERRRMDKSLMHDGKFSAEIVGRYASHFKDMTKYIDGELLKEINEK